MAKIVLGLGTSHTPMLLASDETLQRFVETDRHINHRDKEGLPITYGDLLEKADPKLAQMVAPEHLVARQNIARSAIKHVAQTLAGAKVDALIVIGDDQNESYKEDCRPAFAIYYGDTIRNSNEQHEEYRRRFPEWYVQNRQAFFEDEKPRDYPVHSGLAIHLIETLMDLSFDLGHRSGCPGARAKVTPSPMCIGASWSPISRSRLCRSFSTPTFHPTSRGRAAAMNSARRSARRWKPTART